MDEKMPPLMVDGTPWFDWTQQGLTFVIVTSDDQIAAWLPRLGTLVNVSMEGLRANVLHCRVRAVEYGTEDNHPPAHVVLTVDL